jgi:Site-specific recombinase XerD
MSDWRKELERLEGAYSDHTLRGYAADMQQFELWCSSHGHIALPASPETLVAYVNEEAQRLLPSTLGRRLCGIARIHRLMRHPDPSKDEDVKLAVRRARRKKPARPDQALGVTAKMRDCLIKECTDDLIGLRDEILLRVGFDTLCRRGELVSLLAGDLFENERGNLSILVRRAKNDPTGEGRVAPLSTKTSERIRHWIEAAGIVDGALLRPIYRNKVLRRFLDPVVVSRVLKKLARRHAQGSKLEKGVSGHSLRVGAAQQLTVDGHGILQIMRAGGWKSMNVVARYIENVDLDLWK